MTSVLKKRDLQSWGTKRDADVQPLRGADVSEETRR